MKKNINIIGAFDRYNYGDLLFPIILEEYIKKYNQKLLKNFDIEFYGLVESDLSNVGGKKTKALKNLYKSSQEKGSMIIVSGGDVLPARISSMDIDLSQNKTSMLVKKVLRKTMGTRRFESISMKKFDLNYRFPWIVDSEVFKNQYIVYNAVGGSTLNTLPDYEYKEILKDLDKSTYISVRDEKSFENVISSKPKLYPDSATIMSEFFDISFLEKNISQKVKDAVKSCSNGYICIQSNFSSIRGKEEILIKEAEKICKENNYKLVLLPIGLAANHDDNIALRALKKLSTIDPIHIEDVNIYDIMYFIAKSKFFAGTSLHGNITSMAYGVKHIGLNKEISKLDRYLNTWDLEEQNHCIDFEDLYKEFNIIKNIDQSRLDNKREELVNLTKDNLKELFNCLEEKNNE